ncbi:MAG: FRG domain-containing protein [Oscillospiraceae bacterium]|jgi:hypothetical protein|nr:FRG domain-containing protein [Oscillospiraceae bacterium]
MAYAVFRTFEELKSAIKKVKSQNISGTEFWYRGQGNATYELTPSFFRYPSNSPEKEKEIFETYCRYAQRVGVSRNEVKTDWENLIDMQHYFIPTRLLDWTETLGISLYFALSGYRGEGNIALFLLNPVKLNSYSFHEKIIPTIPEDTRDLSYAKSYIASTPPVAQYPIAIRTNFSNPRVLAQRGMFTVHGADTSPIDKLCPDAVYKLVIGSTAVPEIKEFLTDANINEATVFPDIFGLASLLRAKLAN